MRGALESGAGLERLREMIEAQGGDGRVCEDVDYLPHAAYRIDVPAPRGGYVAKMDTTEIGYCAQDLGAGRKKKTDVIDPAVGLVMRVRLGDAVAAGQPLATLYLNKRELANEAIARMQRAIAVSPERPALPPLISLIQFLLSDGYGMRSRSVGSRSAAPRLRPAFRPAGRAL